MVLKILISLFLNFFDQICCFFFQTFWMLSFLSVLSILMSIWNIFQSWHWVIEKLLETKKNLRQSDLMILISRTVPTFQWNSKLYKFSKKVWDYWFLGPVKIFRFCRWVSDQNLETKKWFIFLRYRIRKLSIISEIFILKFFVIFAYFSILSGHIFGGSIFIWQYLNGSNLGFKRKA